MHKDLQSIVEGALEATIREMVESSIREAAGYGIDDEIKQTIKERARIILDDDDELQEKIRAAMASWIDQATASDRRPE